MHASVLTRQVEQPAHGTCDPGGAPQVQWVEHTDLDVRVGGEGAHDCIQAVTGGVVQQDAYAHAPVGRPQQLMDQGAGAESVMDDVVLHVDAGLRIAYQLGARPESLVAVGE